MVEGNSRVILTMRKKLFTKPKLMLKYSQRSMFYCILSVHDCIMLRSGLCVFFNGSCCSASLVGVKPLWDSLGVVLGVQCVKMCFGVLADFGGFAVASHVPSIVCIAVAMADKQP